MKALLLGDAQALFTTTMAETRQNIQILNKQNKTTPIRVAE
jgi:hypothetical protein